MSSTNHETSRYVLLLLLSPCYEKMSPAPSSEASSSFILSNIQINQEKVCRSAYVHDILVFRLSDRETEIKMLSSLIVTDVHRI